jgi:phosphoglycerate dehydrogenase-like enzyme
MTRLKIVLPELARAHLADLDGDVETAWYENADGCLANVGGAEVVWFHLRPRRLERVLDAGRAVRWLTTLATGLDRWPFELVRERGLLVTNGAGLGAIPISEYVVMGLLAGLKGLPQLVRAQGERTWLRSPPALGELYGKRALIYGYGHIGRAIGERLRPFGVSVTGVRRHPGGDPDVVDDRSWQSRLSETDLLILAVPLTSATRGLVGEAQLSALPDGAWVANIARGGLVDEPALIRALESGRLGGAYLDVTATEPLPADSPLWSMANVLITPHSSWATDRIMGRAADLFRDNLARYRSGQALRNVVDLAAGY